MTERLEGAVTEFDLATRKGVITDLTGAEHFVLPGSFRKTIRLGIGSRVSFASFNLSGGPTAQDIELCREISSGGPTGPTESRGTRASQVPKKV
jgi:hypothetical protein